MSASTRHLNRAALLLFIAIVLGLVAIILPISEASLLSHESTAPVIVPQSAPSGTYFDHLVFIIMENAGIADICGSNLPPPCSGSNTPYMSSLANSYGIETQYVDLAGSSQPNYIGIMAATLNGCSSGCGTNSLTEINLVDRFEAAGLVWKAYMEDQTPVAGCDINDHGFYEVIHNPFVSFHDIDTNATRCNKIALANPANNSTCTGTDCALINDLNSGSAANFMWLTPNDCDNMHGNSACSDKCTTSYTAACNKAGDNYLSGLVPNILNSNTFKNTRAALFITFDEGSGFCPSPNPSGADCMYTVWAGPTTKTNFSSNHADTQLTSADQCRPIRLIDNNGNSAQRILRNCIPLRYDSIWSNLRINKSQHPSRIGNSHGLMQRDKRGQLHAYDNRNQWLSNSHRYRPLSIPRFHNRSQLSHR